jgi:hypothetical protein
MAKKVKEKQDSYQYAKSIVDMLTGEKPKPKTNKKLIVKSKR